MSKKIFITGAAGFIGFHLARHLKARGDHVTGFDNFNSYYTPQLKRDRASILNKLGIEVIEGDIIDSQQLHEVVEKASPTHLVHLAAQAGVRHSITHPHAYVKTNLEGFVNILECCRHFPQIKLTYASSSSVYGLNEKVPFSIDDPTDHQASLYGATKKANELFAQTYHHLYGIFVTGLRFFTVYGPWGRPDMAYFSFTKAILEDRPIEVYNFGKMQRDFTYIDDIVQGITAAVDLEAKCEIFNLGNNSPVELNHFINVLEQALGKKAIKKELPIQAGDVLTTFADIDYSHAKLGFSPAVSIEAGLPRFVEWYKNYFLFPNK